jgi:hypothetical protein
MMFGEGSEWFWAMAQFFAITISLGLIYRQIKIQSQANMLNTLESLADKWNSQFLLRQRHEACAAYPQENLRIENAEGDVLGFFEDLGLYYKRGVFDIEIIWERYSYFVEYYWAMYYSSIYKYRSETADNTWFRCFENLYNAIQNYSKKECGMSAPKTEEQISKFIRGELAVRSSAK